MGALKTYDRFKVKIFNLESPREADDYGAIKIAENVDIEREIILNPETNITQEGNVIEKPLRVAVFYYEKSVER